MDSRLSKLFFMACLLLVFKSGLCAPTSETAEYPNDYINDEDEDSNGEDADTGPPPELLSDPQSIEAKIGADVFLNCITRNSDAVAVTWKRNASEMLYLDATKMTSNDRISRFENNTIHIHRLQYSDLGNYSCRIETSPAIEVVHSIFMLSPAKIIKTIPENRKIVLRKGDTLTLGCEVEGSPKPTVMWMRSPGKTFFNGREKMEGTSLTYENVDRRLTGEYKCFVNNSFGEESALFEVHIEYPPEIEISEETITTSTSLEPELTCTVHADPPAKVRWYKAGQVLSSQGHIDISRVGKKHTLLIKGLKSTDFGSYTCHAENALGSDKKAIVLSGTPSRPQVKVSYPESQKPKLEWSVESHIPVQKYEIVYQSVDNDVKKIYENVLRVEGTMFQGVLVLSDIVGGESEVQVRALNDMGWSNYAKFLVKNGANSGVSHPVLAISVATVASIVTLLL